MRRHTQGAQTRMAQWLGGLVRVGVAVYVGHMVLCWLVLLCLMGVWALVWGYGWVWCLVPRVQVSVELFMLDLDGFEHGVGLVSV